MRRTLWLLLLCLLLLAKAQHQPTLLAAAAAANADTTEADADASTQGNSTVSRFFIDEGYFLEGDTEILRAYIAASGGRMTISGESSAAFLSVKGYYVPESWDVYWTIRSACHMAYKHMGPQQHVNCIPGISAMSLKRTFVTTWQQAYGELAFNFIPRSYLIPQQYWLWRSHLLATASPPDTNWVLKANIHRGKGVSVLPQREALSHALTHKREPDGSSSSSSDGSSSEGGVHYLNVLVQSYLQQQLVIAGRSSYIRVWLLVTSINPLRAYLFDGGFAIFGKQKGPPAAAAKKAGGAAAAVQQDDLIVNLWIQDRNSSPIWSLKHLQDYLAAHPDVVLPLPPPPSTLPQQQARQQQPRHKQQQQGLLGRHLLQANTAAAAAPASSSNNTSSSSSQGTPQQQQPQQRRRTFADAWKDMQTAASLVLAAALPAMRAAAVETGAPQQGTFEYFGLDFVFDAHLQPWMLEVNAIPSMARRKKSECAGEAATAACKLTTPAAAAAGGAAASGARSNSSSSATTAASAALAADDFDAQKERFVHDMLVLLGLPVDTAAAADSTSNTHSPQDAAGVLRMAAAAAAAAGIRSAQPLRPAAVTAAANSSSSSSSASSSDRRRLSSLGQKALQQQGSTAGQGQQQQRRSVVPLLAFRRQQLQHKAHSRHARAAAAGPSAQELPGTRSSSSTGSKSDTSTDSPKQARQGFMGVPGLQWAGPTPTLVQLPAQLQKLLCPAGTSTGTTNNPSATNPTSSQFACISCLTADDLAGLAAAEGELQRAGSFVPVHDLITAHSINKHALRDAAAAPANATITNSSSSSVNAGAADDGSSGDNGLPAAAAAAPGGAYLSQSPSVWQKLHSAWKGLSHSRSHEPVRDLGVMKYYTTASKVSAHQELGLGRMDYVMSAWLRVRVQESCAGGLPVADCVVKRLSRLVNNCYLQ